MAAELPIQPLNNELFIEFTVANNGDAVLRLSTRAKGISADCAVCVCACDI